MLFPPITWLITIPLLSMLLLLVVPKRQEKIIAGVALTGIGVTSLIYLTVLYQWVLGGFAPISIRSGELYIYHQVPLVFEWYFDGISAVFFGLTCSITYLIFLFSKYYMHRDPGFSRYFKTMLLFVVGLALIIVSGNLEMLFLGWEWIGMSSFILIGYYRDRFLPVRNALKVFSLYRIADAILVLAIWLAHHLIHEAGGFSQYHDLTVIHEDAFAVLGLLFVLVALIKSAQFPFSYWLPRAMEGPTTSSAIFYGALSVHMGLFILMRTYPLWEGNLAIRMVVAIIGISTSIIATGITRVQSSVKTQIAYASITQIGIMFIEVAFGMHWLALLHMVSNAFLRTYQLLISPSIVGYLIHDQFFYFVPPRVAIPNTFLGKMRATFFVLNIKEWNMNAAITSYVWKPLKDIGRRVSFLDATPAWLSALLIFLTAIGSIAVRTATSPIVPYIGYAAILISLLFFIRAYSTKYTPQTSWNLIMMGNILLVIFFTVISKNTSTPLLLYATGILVAYSVGNLCLAHLTRRGETVLLGEYHGHVYEYPRLAFVFFLVCLAYMGFPITPTFLGQDILLSMIPMESMMVILLFCVAYLISGIAIMRLYTKVFFGPHEKRYHEVARKTA